MSGGFVGVDVFFVISGFVITKSIIGDRDKDRFSMAEFYRRRVARILPALILVILVTMALGAVLMLPSELRELGKSAAATTFFSSNFYFLFTSDYFGGAAESKPLLHTWSLAVEEQFYIFYPIIIMLLWGRGVRFVRNVILLLCVTSFLAAVFIGRINPDISFYMLPTRAWELGMGALVALGAHPSVQSVVARQILAACGMVLILFAIFVVRPGPLFPAPLALLPTLGSALIVAYGSGTWTGGLLSVRPIKGIGDISYSLYLWHWPVITFYRLQSGFELGYVETIFLTLVSIALATATFYLLENPSKARINRLPRTRVLATAGVVLSVAAGGAILLSTLPNNWRHYPTQVIQLAKVASYRDTSDYKEQFRKGVCFFGEGDAQTFNKSCLQPDPKKPDLVVFGDSHAAQYWKAFAEQRPEWNVIQATASGCRPIIDGEGAKRCTDMVAYAFEHLLKRGVVDEVVFAGRWSSSELPALQQAVKRVQAEGIVPIVVGPVVEYEGDQPLIMARAAMSGDMKSVERFRVNERRDVDRLFKKGFESLGGGYVSEHELECPQGRCRLTDEAGLPLHFDYGHLTLSGARIIVADIEDQRQEP